MTKITAVVAAVLPLFTFAGIDSASYVQRGLNGHWDGIDNAGRGVHSASPSVWKDLSGKATDLDLSGGGITVFDNRVRFEDTVVPVTAYNTAVSATSSLSTIFDASAEIACAAVGECIAPAAVSNSIAVGVQMDCWGVYSIGLRHASDTYGRYAAGCHKASGDSYSAYYCNPKVLGGEIATRNTYGSCMRMKNFTPYVGGERRTGTPFSNPGYNSKVTRTTVGARGGNSGDIWAIRFYDRPLTDSEMALNAAIDRVRFDGADPAVMTWPDGYRYNDGDIEVRVSLTYGSEVSSASVNGTAVANGGTVWVKLHSAYSVRKIANNGLFTKIAGAPSNAVYGHGGFDVDDADIPADISLVASTLVPEGYIAESLHSYFDGYNNSIDSDGNGYHDPNATTWADLATRNTTRSVLTNAGTTAMVCLDNGFNTTTATQFFLGTANGLATACTAVDGVTTEMVQYFPVLPSGNQSAYAGAGGMCYYHQNNMQYCVYGRMVIMESRSVDWKFYSFNNSVNADNCDENFFSDGVFKQFAQKSGWTSNTYRIGDDVCIGNKFAGRYDNVNYHALRLYSRRLSAAEIAWNTAIDKRRFKDGVCNAVQVSADGTRLKYLVSIIHPNGTGTITVNGGETMTEGNLYVDMDSLVTITANPVNGYQFQSFIGLPDDAVVNDGTATYRASSAVNVQAVFKQSMITSRSVIQKGLLSHWDAIDNVGYETHDNEAPVWKDLVGESHIALTNAAVVKNVQWSESYLDFTSASTGDNTSLITDGRYNFVDNGLTLELFGYSKGNAFNAFNLPVYDNTLKCTYSDGILQTIGSASASFGERVYNVPLALVSTFTGCQRGHTTYRFEDGELVTSNSATNNSAQQNKQITANCRLVFYRGANAGARAYSMRVYNRDLTLDEVKFNVFCDQVRYYGLDPTVSANWPDGYRYANGRVEVRVRIAALPAEINGVTVNGTAVAAVGCDIWIALSGGLEVKTTGSAPGCFLRFVGCPDALECETDNGVLRVAELTRPLTLSPEAATLTPEGYIAAGLYSYFDGYNNSIDNEGNGYHDPDATTWADLATRATTRNVLTNMVGASSVPLTTAACSMRLDCPNGMNSYFDGESVGAKNATLASDQYTFEMCQKFDSDSDKGGGAFHVGNRGFHCQGNYQYYSDQLYRIQSTHPVGFMTVAYADYNSADRLCSSRADVFAKNGVIEPYSSHSALGYGPYKVDSDRVRIGNCRWTTQKGYENIYSCRYYVRRLSAAEIAWNAMVDRFRYENETPADIRVAADGKTLETKLHIPAPFGGGSVRVNGGDVFSSGDAWVPAYSESTVEVIPPEGKYFTSATFNGKSTIDGNTVTVVMDGANPTLRIDNGATSPSDAWIFPAEGLFIHLDANATESLLLDTAGRVTNWLFQADSSAQGSFVKHTLDKGKNPPYSAAAAVGSRPGVVFGRVTDDDGVTRTAGQTALQTNKAYCRYNAVFAVFQDSATGFHQGGIFSRRSGAYQNEHLSIYGNHYIVNNYGFADLNGITADDVTNCVRTAQMIHSGAYLRGRSDFDFDVPNVYYYASLADIASDTDLLMLGSTAVNNSYYTSASLGEILIYKRVPGVYERMRTEQALLLKWKDAGYSSHTFIGNDEEWTKTANWSNGVLPGEKSLVVIPADKTVTVDGAVKVKDIAVFGSLIVDGGELEVGRFYLADGSEFAANDAKVSITDLWMQDIPDVAEPAAFTLSGNIEWYQAQGRTVMPVDMSLSGNIVKKGLGDWILSGNVDASSCELTWMQGRLDTCGHDLAFKSIGGGAIIFNDTDETTQITLANEGAAELTPHFIGKCELSVSGGGTVKASPQRGLEGLDVDGSALAAAGYTAVSAVPGEFFHVDAMTFREKDGEERFGVTLANDVLPTDFESRRAKYRNCQPPRLHYAALGTTPDMQLPPVYSATALNGLPGLLFGAKAATAAGMDCEFATNNIGQFSQTWTSGISFDLDSKPFWTNRCVTVVLSIDSRQIRRQAVSIYCNWYGPNGLSVCTPSEGAYLTTGIPWPEDENDTGGCIRINGKALYDRDRGIDLIGDSRRIPFETDTPMVITIAYPDSMQTVPVSKTQRSPLARLIFGMGEVSVPFSGVISEVVAMSEQPSAGDLAALESALMAKWGITPDPAADEAVVSGTCGDDEGMPITLSDGASVNLGGLEADVSKFSFDSDVTISGAKLNVAAIETTVPAGGTVYCASGDATWTLDAADVDFLGEKPLCGKVIKTKSSLSGTLGTVTPPEVAPKLKIGAKSLGFAGGLMIIFR